MDIKYAYVGNLTKSRDDKGFLTVKGLASDDTLDLDGQRVDPVWLEKAMTDWFQIGNIREMHSMKAIGKGIDLEQAGTGFNLTAKVVDQGAALLVDEGVLTGFSIGIKGARVDRSKSALEIAPDGIIKGGTIVEVSLVDRPANPSCKVDVLKAAGQDADVAGTENPDVEDVFCATCAGTGKVHVPGLASDIEEQDCQDCAGTGKISSMKADEGSAKSVEGDLEKKDYSDKQRENMASAGQALPDGSYPIKTVGDLKNAIQAFGRAKDKPKTKAHIKARAEALGREDLIPDNWKGAEADLAKAEDMEHDPDDLAAVRQSLINLIKAELDEMANGDENEVCDVRQLLTALDLFTAWWEAEADENETTQPFSTQTEDDMNVFYGLGIEPDVVKAASASDATDENRATLREELRKSLGFDEIATYKAEIDQQAEEITSLKAALEDVRKMAAPGGPALRATNTQQARAAEAEELELKAAKFSEIAKSAADAQTASQYMAAAVELSGRAKAIRNNL